MNTECLNNNRWHTPFSHSRRVEPVPDSAVFPPGSELEEAQPADSSTRVTADCTRGAESVLAVGDGRTVIASVIGGEHQVQFRNPAGEVELSVRLTDHGPVLVFESAALEIRTPGAVSVDCASLSLKTRDGIRTETGGDWETRIGGNERISVSGVSVHESKEVDITTTEGELRIQGAGDAWITAPMVLLNCDREEEMRERQWKSATVDHQANEGSRA